MDEDKKNSSDSFMIRLATLIVDKRNLIFLMVIILVIFSLFSRSWVKVESELSAFLPDDSETRQGLNIMEEQFTTYGTAEFMIANISYSEAQTVCKELEAVKGVQSVSFDDSAEHYNNVSALYSVSFDYDESDDACLEVLDEITELLSSYDLYVSTELGNALAETIATEVSGIMVIVAFIVTAVLVLTSQTYAEVPVLLLTFVVGMILNLGSNFLLGKISFVSNSVTSILQLALSLDYAVILCNRFKEEHRTLPTREAVILALSKAIPEISASCLTTIGGLAAMMFMKFKIGQDMGICLIKSIMYALMSVFLLMPGLLVLFAPLMDKTVHKVFIPKIPFVGRYAYLTRKIVPPIFAVIIVLAFSLSNKCPYAYGYDGITTPKLNDTQIAENMIKDNFSASNMVALVVPAGDYDNEKDIMDRLSAMDEVDYCMGLANIEAMGGYTLADRLTPREFSELADLDYEVAVLLYTAYATENEDYGKVVGGISSYSVPLIDLFMFAYDQIDAGYVTLATDQRETLNDAYAQMSAAKAQLSGEDYNRMLVFLTLPEGGETTYAFLDTMRDLAQAYYPDGNVYVAGNSTTQYDFEKSFSEDNLVVSIISLLIVLLVLLFTFKSAGLPILLIMVIQGSIWINFSVPALTNAGVFFMSYLVVSSIQMGANIDYAIVIASRFNELKNELDKKDAIIETMNFAFPTIITSGSILAIAGMLIGAMTSEVAIVGIGQNLGRGTIISIILVMFVLPQILLLGEKVVDKTSFSVPSAIRSKAASGKVMVDGRVYGRISGTVSGTIHAIVDGDVDVKLISGSVAEEEYDEE